MSKVWRAVMVVVLIAILAGAVCVGVGLMTGGSWEHIYSVLDEKYHLDVWLEWVRGPFAQFIQDSWTAVTSPAV